jgi:hypothetical protein
MHARSQVRSRRPEGEVHLKRVFTKAKEKYMEFVSDLRPEYDSLPTFSAVITCVSDDDKPDEFGSRSLVVDVEFPGHSELDEVGVFSVHLCGERLERVALCYYELPPGEYDHLPIQSGMKGVFEELVAIHIGDLLRLRAKLVRDRGQRLKEQSIETDCKFYQGQLHETLGVLQQMQRILRFSEPVPDANDPTKAIGLDLTHGFCSREDVVPELIELTTRCHDAVQHVITYLEFT